MTKAELIREIKRIQKEEQDYQALFKLMLKRSGKDIDSMSDGDKKKFFTAVDKAYKAKTEGKLKINNKYLNEDFSSLFGNVIFLALLAKAVQYFWAYSGWKANKKKYKDQDEFAINFILDKIKNNQSLSKDVAKIIMNKGSNITLHQAADIAELPAVAAAIRQANIECQKKFKEKNSLSEEVIEAIFAEFVRDTWNNNEVKNKIIEKLKNDIK